MAANAQTAAAGITSAFRSLGETKETNAVSANTPHSTAETFSPKKLATASVERYVNPINANGRFIFVSPHAGIARNPAIMRLRLFEEKRKRLQEYNILALRGIAFREHGGLADDISAGSLDKALDGVKRFAGADNVVNY